MNAKNFLLGIAMVVYLVSLAACSLHKRGDKFREEIWANINDDPTYILEFEDRETGERFFKNVSKSDSETNEGVLVINGIVEQVYKPGELNPAIAIRKKKYIDRENELRRQRAEQERRAIELETVARAAREAEDEKFKQILRDNNSELVYRRGSFIVGKNIHGDYIYIKDGVIKSQSQLKEEIAAFQRYIEDELKAEMELRDVRAKNLAYRWVVQAQAVCSSGMRCWITRIKEETRNPDGSVIFSISYERWRGTGGGTGSTYITCGFNKQNVLRSTAVTAVCQ